MERLHNVSIFDFLNAAEYLQAVFQDIQKKRPRYSIRAWSQRMNIPQSTLSRVLQGSREIPKNKVNRLVQVLELDIFEACYFELIAKGPKLISDDRLSILKKILQDQQNHSLTNDPHNEQS